MGWEAWVTHMVPRRCRGCSRPGALFCLQCLRLIGQMSPSLHPPPQELPLVFAAGGTYHGVLRDAVLLHKAHVQSSVRAALAALLWRTCAAVAPILQATGVWTPPVALVPVPPSVQRPWRLPVAELLTPPATSDLVPSVCLYPSRRRRPQKGLDALARARNVDGAFAVRMARLPVSGSVILVDDVVTTGATLAACCGILAAVGRAPCAAIGVAVAHGGTQ